MFKSFNTIIINSFFVCFSLTFAFFLSEVAYRSLLYFDNPKKFLLSSIDLDNKYTSSLYNVSHWEFDSDLGYYYPPGRKITLTHITDNKVTCCSTFSTINKIENIGPIIGDYYKSQYKIALFGDSFPATINKNQTFVSMLQTKLSDKFNKDIHVLNFGRDGIGVKQIFKIASVKAKIWKPDLIIIAFISDEINRVPIWRTVVKDKEFQRVLTTTKNKKTLI